MGADTSYKIKRFGWLPDYPSLKDYTIETPKVQEVTKIKANPRRVQVDIENGTLKLESRNVKNREKCSPVQDQLDIGSCTAFMGVGMYEYMENKSHGKYIKGSELFLYKVTRNLIHLVGDTGAYIRSAIGAMTIFGVPPAEHYPYNTKGFENEPSAFLYAFGQSFQAIKYFKFDAGALMTNRTLLITTMKDWISRGYILGFGFTVYDSYTDATTNKGKLPFPSRNENVQGGHAVIAVGYDDSVTITNPRDGNTQTGAFLIKNSWGTGWGDAGYGWIPYKYFETGLAEDIWTMTRVDWVDTGRFNYPE